MKLISKLALLGCASIGLVGMAQAQVTVKQLGNVQDMACALPVEQEKVILRLAHYKIHNSGPTEVELDFELYNNDSFPDSVITFYKISCGSVESGDFATGVLASHADCQIDLLISPPTCPVINGYPVGDIDAEYGPASGVINRAIEIDINTRQVDLTIPLTGNTKSAHLPRVTTLGAAAEFGLLAGSDIESGDYEGPTQVNFGNVGAVGSLLGQIQMIDGIKYPDNALPTQIALMDVQSTFDMFDQIEGCDYPDNDLSGETLVPGYYCLDGNFVDTEQTLTLSGDGIYVFKVFGGAICLPPECKNQAGAFDLGAFASVVLADGAKADNVYWAVYHDSLFLGYESTLVGNIISAENDNNFDAFLEPFEGIAQVNGRLLTTDGIFVPGNSIIVP